MNVKEQFFEYMELIKFEHTLFALPFAMSGMLIALPEGYPELWTFVWVVVAIVSARTAAMALNRFVDAEIDKKNPRTKDRAIPAGRIKKISALALSLISFGFMTWSVLHLNDTCVRLLPLAILLLGIYSYTKRFTYLSHFVLGGALGAAAVGGWLAVVGEVSLPIVLWGLAIVFWVSGFDIVYALMDIEFDMRENLFSIPVKLGIGKSLLLSKIFHIITVLMLLSIYFLHIKTFYYLMSVIYMAVVLLVEHIILRQDDIKSINISFFNMNAFASVGFFVIILFGKILSENC